MSETEIYIYKIKTHGREIPEQKFLDAGEFERYQNSTNERRRTEFLHSRFLAKSVFRNFHGIVNPEIRISSNGKPKIKKLKFNLSHSQDYVVLAANSKADLGVDIERTKVRKHFLEIARTYFSAAEYKFICKTKSSAQRYKRFKALWSLKEAYIKAFDGKVNSRSLKIYFDLENKKIVQKPTKKPIYFFYNEKLNIGLCLKGTMSQGVQSELVVYAVDYSASHGLSRKKINLKFAVIE